MSHNLASNPVHKAELGLVQALELALVQGLEPVRVLELAQVQALELERVLGLMKRKVRNVAIPLLKVETYLERAQAQVVVPELKKWESNVRHADTSTSDRHTRNRDGNRSRCRWRQLGILNAQISGILTAGPGGRRIRRRICTRTIPLASAYVNFDQSRHQSGPGHGDRIGLQLGEKRTSNVIECKVKQINRHWNWTNIRRGRCVREYFLAVERVASFNSHGSELIFPMQWHITRHVNEIALQHTGWSNNFTVNSCWQCAAARSSDAVGTTRRNGRRGNCQWYLSLRGASNSHWSSDQWR
jgi:hypothetical protein